MEGCTVVKHSLHHPKIKGLSLAKATGTGREEMMKKAIQLVHGGSTVVKHSPCHPKIEGLYLAMAAGSWRQKMMKESKLWTWR